ncbi:MAG: hypothetical protein WA129_06935, partial [Acidovorax sp.]
APWICGQLASELPTSPTGLDCYIVFFKSSSIRNDEGPPLPPAAEQSRIVTRVTALRRLCADLRQRLAEREAVQSRLAEALVASVA